MSVRQTPTGPAPLLFRATDVRRLPLFGVACGLALAASILAWMEKGVIVTLVVVAAWCVAAVLILGALPSANTLRLDEHGFRLRSFGVFRRFVPWRDVVAVETGDGWVESRLIIELAEGADRGFVFGLPRDAELGRRVFADGYGLSPEELAAEMARFRAVAHP